MPSCLVVGEITLFTFCWKKAFRSFWDLLDFHLFSRSSHGIPIHSHFCSFSGFMKKEGTWYRYMMAICPPPLPHPTPNKKLKVLIFHYVKLTRHSNWPVSIDINILILIWLEGCNSVCAWLCQSHPILIPSRNPDWNKASWTFFKVLKMFIAHH
jgi:hypothetical protein